MTTREPMNKKTKIQIITIIVLAVIAVAIYLVMQLVVFKPSNNYPDADQIERQQKFEEEYNQIAEEMNAKTTGTVYVTGTASEGTAPDPNYTTKKNILTNLENTIQNNPYHYYWVNDGLYANEDDTLGTLKGEIVVAYNTPVEGLNALTRYNTELVNIGFEPTETTTQIVAKKYDAYQNTLVQEISINPDWPENLKEFVEKYTVYNPTGDLGTATGYNPEDFFEYSEFGKYRKTTTEFLESIPTLNPANPGFSIATITYCHQTDPNCANPAELQLKIYETATGEPEWSKIILTLDEETFNLNEIPGSGTTINATELDDRGTCDDPQNSPTGHGKLLNQPYCGVTNGSMVQPYSENQFLWDYDIIRSYYAHRW